MKNRSRNFTTRVTFIKISISVFEVRQNSLRMNATDVDILVFDCYDGHDGDDALNMDGSSVGGQLGLCGTEATVCDTSREPPHPDGASTPMFLI